MADSDLLPRPKRWDKPFATPESIPDLAEVLSLPLFEQIDPDNFPPSLPIFGIIENDARIIHVKRDEIIIRAGDYGNSAFLILSGKADVVLPPGLPEKLLGRSDNKNSLISKVLDTLNLKKKDNIAHSSLLAVGDGETVRTFLPNAKNVMSELETITLEAGDIFGEVAALTRAPRIASIIAQNDCKLLEIRWQGLREMRKYSPRFQSHVDQYFRDRNMISYLRNIKLFSGLDNESLDELAKETLFESYGEADWYTQHEKLESSSIEHEAMIAAEDSYADGVLIVLSGFARISHKYNNGEQTTGFLRAGDVFGLEDIHQQHAKKSSDNAAVYGSSLRAIGYTNVLRIPSWIIEETILGSPSTDAWLTVNQSSIKPNELTKIGMLEFLMDHYYINGTSTMMIDMERCIRCDDCVTACASAHNNVPQFSRSGEIHNQFMIASACMHCTDPVCLVGCPTGAIHRSSEKGEVIINENTCIGCETCANACPYDNIQMVTQLNKEGLAILDEKTHKPLLKATKCDLCINKLGGPACVNACPHDALVRVDMKENPTLTNFLDRHL